MTAQIGDRFTFKGEDYSIVSISKSINFSPYEYGLKPFGCCTACWAGYWCHYDISKDGIVLRNLYINSESGYPKINDVDVSDTEYIGHRVYQNLNLPMNYTGKILVGNNFINKYYIHMGYQRAWAYETLVELVFENGKLVEEIDQSEVAKKLRESFDDEKFSIERMLNIPKFVKESFSLDFADKAWWL